MKGVTGKDIYLCDLSDRRECLMNLCVLSWTNAKCHRMLRDQMMKAFIKI